ncbi:MAG: hypothetical protein JST23_04820 [Bacteroidetes bacterium]|nr:hypothetical protein [Bacteroidota bacterium]
MALNKNHEYEDWDGVRYGIVEKNVSSDRAAFLKDILEHNGYTVAVAPAPAPKAAPAPKPAEGEVTAPQPEVPTPPSLFHVGVTDYTFNSTNAIFGRALKTKDGHIVTLAYWQQKSPINNDEQPYYEFVK